jgi:outer membrane receptor for ferrienterochelin and colicins
MHSRPRVPSHHARPAAALLLATLLTGPLGAASGSESPTQLDPLDYVTTATRTERLLTEAPVRTELLTPEVFRASGSTDLAAALAYLPGAQVEANCQNCGTAEVKLLGLGAAYNQLLFDQQPLFGGLAAVYGLEHIPTAFLDRIEVVKGGASTLYGPGAVAGVINLIPREPVLNGAYVEARAEARRRHRFTARSDRPMPSI